MASNDEAEVVGGGEETVTPPPTTTTTTTTTKAPDAAPDDTELNDVVIPDNNKDNDDENEPENTELQQQEEEQERLLRRRRRSTVVLFTGDADDPDLSSPGGGDNRSNPKQQQQQLQQRQSNNNRKSTVVLSDSILLATSQKHVKRAIMAVLFCVFVDAINLQCAAPNYPLMATIGGHPDSFPHTDPFDFSAAQYMLYAASKMGALISNLTAGTLADSYGRRRVLLINLAGSVVFTIAKYAAQSSYWWFVAMTFCNGLFGSSAAVSTGYMADLFVGDRSKADTYINNVIAIMVVGRSLGGLLTVMFPDDLFLPLIPAACLTIVGWIVAYKLVLEPKGMQKELGIINNNNTSEGKKDDDNHKKEQDQDHPETMDNKALFNIVLGGLIDNGGSVGIVPLGLSPLMFDVFHNDLIEQGLEPIMREQTYRWLYSMIAVVAIPGALISPMCYQRFGIALSSVIVNLLTAATILALMTAALQIDPPTKGSFALCSSIIYFAFPFTLISQFSIGPMLDRIAPLDKKGFAQGIYGTVADGASAIFPFIFGLIADSQGIDVTLWICIGVSVLAAIVNFPLIFHPRLQKPPKKKKKDDGTAGGFEEGDDDDATVTLLDEEAMQQKLVNGEFVPSKDIWAVNVKRLERGEPFLHTNIGTYTPGCADDYHIPKEEYMFLRDMAEQRLMVVKEKEEHKIALAEAINFLDSDSVQTERDRQLLGEWISQYLVDSGYKPAEHSPILKAMIKSSFPKLSSRVVTPENVETRLVRISKLMNDYMEREGLDEPPSFFRIFSSGNRGAGGYQQS